MDNPKQMIVLYGKANQGKTTTLRQLIISLIGNDPEMAQAVNALFKRNQKTKDIRIIVNYRGVLVFIATGGDAWSICRSSCEFFDGKFAKKKDIYIVDAKGLRQLTGEGKTNYESKPIVTVCACRPFADGNGAIKAIHSYSVNHIMDYSEQIWLKKDGIKNDDMMSVLKRRIDEFINNNYNNLKRLQYETI